MKVKSPEPGIYTIDYFGPSLTILFSGREFPNERHDNFLQRAGIDPARLSSMRQVHGSNIVRVGTGALSCRDVDADGMICSERGIALAVRTADCIPMYIWDPEKKVIGLAHIGWRGAYHRLASKMAAAFRQNFGSRREDLCVLYGPSIRSCCYEVGSEFSEYFPNAFHAFSNKGKSVEVMTEAPGTVDLISAVSEELLSEGLDRHHLYDTMICTACQTDSFFSYRGENKTRERMLSVFLMND